MDRYPEPCNPVEAHVGLPGPERALSLAAVRDAADPARAIRNAVIDGDNPEDDIAILVARMG